MISELIGLDINKLKRLMDLLDYVDYDIETKTLTVDQSLRIKIKGNYIMETDKHLFLNSNYTVLDNEVGIPFSVLMNTDETQLRQVKANIDKMLEDMKNMSAGSVDEGDCGCH